MSSGSDHLGHRARLRERFLDRGADALADYEMIELLLFQALPRRDTKPVAKALIERFGSYAGVLRAAPAELGEVDGMGKAAVAAIRVVAEAATRLAREEALGAEVLGSWDRLVAYLRIRLAHEKTECFRLLFLDAKNRLIADEEMHRGTVNHTPVYPREVMKRALELTASAVIMVHNHPSGDPSPSKADIDMTREIRDVGKSLGIVLHDHVIVARGGHSSLRAMGLLD
ncbi:MAG: DNA repair protein RadC [Defluviicoccus sp.]|nr:DNA repair protein RadC [Defluviicoccus sp.]